MFNEKFQVYRNLGEQLGIDILARRREIKIINNTPCHLFPKAEHLMIASKARISRLSLDLLS